MAWSRTRGRPALRAYVALAALGLVGGFALASLGDGGHPLLAARDLTRDLTAGLWSVASAVVVAAEPLQLALVLLVGAVGVGLPLLLLGSGRPVLRAYVAVAALSLVMGLAGGFALASLGDGGHPLERAEHATFWGVGVPGLSANERDVPTAAGGSEEGRLPPGDGGRYSANPAATSYASGGASPASASASASASVAPSASASASASPSSGGDGRTIVNIEAGGLDAGSTEYIQASATATTTYACVDGGGQIPDASNEQTTTSTVTAPAQPFIADENGYVSGTLTLSPPGAESNTLVCPPDLTETFQGVTYTDALAKMVTPTSATATAAATASPTATGTP